MITILEATGSPAGVRWRVRVIRAGLSGNGNLYPDSVLREAVTLFDGARVFVKSDAEHLAGGGKDVRNLVGKLTEPVFVEARNGEPAEIQAVLNIIEPDGAIGTKIREAHQRNMSDIFGLSIDATGKAEPAQFAGRTVRKVTQLSAVKSVDLIVEPGAGGQIIHLIEAQGKTAMEGTALNRDQIELMLVKSGLPQHSQDRLLAVYSVLPEVTEKTLREAIGAERSYLARINEGGKVRGLGDDSRVELIEGRPAKVAKMLDAFFDPKHKDHRHAQSIRECYVDITGDRNFTGLIRNCDEARLRESLDSSSFDQVLGDAITRRMVADYRTPSVYDAWKAVATTVPVADFRTQRRVRYGGYGDLPAVAQRAPYTALSSPTDEEATYAISKRGGTEDISLEMIANDDVGAVRKIPTKLSRAAKRTLAKFVLDFPRTNPTIYDGVALFHASHGNLGSTALSGAQVAAGRLIILKQTEMNSADRLGVGPKSILVPPDLEETAVDLFRRNTNNDKTFVQSLTLDVVPVWYWTDANDWVLSTDPMDVPTIEVGFFNGNEEPELFVQDDPKVGSMFSNDVLTYKIRHIYGGTVVDFRGLFKAVVA